MLIYAPLRFGEEFFIDKEFHFCNRDILIIKKGLLQFHLLMEWQRPLFFDFNNREKEKNPVFPEEIRDFCVHYPDHSQEWL